MDKNIGATSVPDSSLVSLHQKYSSHALSTFQKSAASPVAFQQTYEAVLKEGIANHFDKVKKANDEKLEEEKSQRKIQEDMKIEHQRREDQLRREKEEGERRAKEEKDAIRREYEQQKQKKPFFGITLGPFRILF